MYFFDEKLQFTYPLTSIKDVQTTVEAYKKENIQHYKT